MEGFAPWSLHVCIPDYVCIPHYWVFVSVFTCTRTFWLRRSWQLESGADSNACSRKFEFAESHCSFHAGKPVLSTTYFGQLNVYRAKQTPPLPQDVDTWTPTLDKTPANVSTPGFDAATGKPGPPIKAFHMRSACSENLTPSWNETHHIWNLAHPGSGAFTMDGFAFVEGKFAHEFGAPQLFRFYRQTRDGLLRRLRSAFLLLHGCEFRHLRSLVFSCSRAHAS